MTSLTDNINESSNSERQGVRIKLFKKVKVKNLNHQPDENSTLLQDWEDVTDRTATCCANLNCPNKQVNPALVGGHVYKVGDDTDDNWYITPLCHMCNSPFNLDEIEVYERNLVRLKSIRCNASTKNNGIVVAIIQH